MNRIISGILAFVAANSVWALEVTTQMPGQLANNIEDKAISTLEIKGPVNAADLFWIGNNLRELKELNLSAAQIVAYKGDMLQGQVEYDAAYLPQGVFAGTKLTSVKLPLEKPTVIGDMAFAGTQLTALPAGEIAVIGQGAFASCPIKQLILEKQKVEGYAFTNCATEKVSLIGTAVLPEGIFDKCTALTTVEGSEGLTEIGARAFEGCTALKQITLGKALKIIGSRAFANSGISDINVSEAANLEKVSAWAFADCKELKEATFAEGSHAAFGEGVFFHCSELEKLQLPKTFVKVPSFLLKGAEKAVTTEVPEGIEEIGAFAYKDNKAITEIKLPSTLQHIGQGAMEGATGLQRIDATAVQQVPTLDADVWADINQKNVVLDVKTEQADEFRAADQWKDFTINDVSSADDIAGSVAAAVKGRFVGTTLELLSTGSAIGAVALYNSAGMLLTTAAPAAESCSIETSGFADKIYVVAVRLENGTLATLKIAR